MPVALQPVATIVPVLALLAACAPAPYRSGDTDQPSSTASASPPPPDLTGALFVKDDAVVNPPCIARFLVREAQQLGAEVILKQRVVHADGKSAILDKGASIACKNVVLANGELTCKLHERLSKEFVWPVVLPRIRPSC